MNFMRISIQQDQLPSVGEIHSKFMPILYMKGRPNEPGNAYKCLQIAKALFRKVSRVMLSTASETGHVNPRRLSSHDASCTTAE